MQLRCDNHVGNAGDAAGPDPSGKPVAMAQIKAAAKEALASALGKETPNARVADTPVRKTIPHHPDCGFQSLPHHLRVPGFHWYVVASVRSAPRIHTATRTEAMNGMCGAQTSTSTPASAADPPDPPGRAAAAATPAHVESPVSDSDQSHAALKPKAPPQPPVPYVQPDWGGVPAESFSLEVRVVCSPPPRVPTFQLPVEPSIECAR